jgi:protease-4
MLFRLPWALLANTLLNLLLVPLWLWRRAGRRARVLLRLEGAIPDYAPPSPWWRRYRGASVERVDELVDRVLGDPRSRGLVLLLGRIDVGLATLDALRASLGRLRQGGKELVVHLEDVGTRELVLAAGADVVLAAEGSLLDLRGLAIELGFYGGALARLGVEIETAQTGPYKNAGERLTRDRISPAQREALERYLDGAYQQLVVALAQGRGIPEERVRQLIDDGPYDGGAARDLGLVDATVSRESLPRLLGGLDADQPIEQLARQLAPQGPQSAGGEAPSDTAGKQRAAKAALVPAGSYLRRWRPRYRPFFAPRVIAVVPLTGAIHGGWSSGVGAGTIGDRSTRRVLARLAQQRRVAAVVVQIDSRGGSASASDQIWAAVRELAAKKPVLAVMGNVAASGGYYIACGCDAIYATPQTLTGSIGVLAARLSLDGLSTRLGVGSAVLARGKRAALYGVRQPLDRGIAPPATCGGLGSVLKQVLASQARLRNCARTPTRRTRAPLARLA